MGLPSSVLYAQGGCHVYYEHWALMTEQEKLQSREQILENIYASRGAGSVTKDRDKSLDTEYICASKMHGTHELLSDQAFHSHKFGYPVCGAPLDISQRGKKGCWRHCCKQGPPTALDDRGDGKCKWPVT